MIKVVSLLGLLIMGYMNSLIAVQDKKHTYRNQERRLSVKNVEFKKNKLSNKERARKLFLEEANMPQGNVYTEQLQNTNSNLNEMMSHSKRQTEMKQVGQWFSDVDERLDDFRDAVSRKLNELHMALQRPKVPMVHQFGGNPFNAASQMQSMVANPGGMSGGMGSMSPMTLGASLSSDRMKRSL